MADEGKPGAEDQPEAEKPQEKESTGEAAETREAKPPADEAVETPRAEFVVIVHSIATQALVGLGKIKNPLTNKKEVDLKGAKFSVDLLQVLAEKTRGNLTETEERYLQGILYQLRMAYVEAAK